MPEEEMQIVMKASDILKKDDFLKSFKAVIELVTKVQKKVLEDHQKSMEMMHSMMNEITEKLKEGNLGNFSSLKKEIFGMKDGMMAEHKRGMGKMYEEYEKMAKEQREGMNFIYDKMRTMKSGKDGESADEEKIIDKVLKKLPKKDFDFESLKTEIKDTLKNEIEKVRNVLSNLPRGKGMGRAKVPITRFVDLTSQVNGVATTFTLEPDTVRVYGILSTQFPQIWNTTDWSFSGRTLTLNFTLQSGQSLVVITESLFYP